MENEQSDQALAKTNQSVAALRKEATQIANFQSFEASLEFSNKIFDSGICPKSIPTPESLAAILLYGKELGLTPMVSMMNIHYFSGRPCLSVFAILRQIRLADMRFIFEEDMVPIMGGKDNTVVVDYRTTIRVEEYWHGEKIVVGRFSLLYTECGAFNKNPDGSTKDVWKKYFKWMMRYRLVSSTARLVNPEALMGCQTLIELADEKGVDFNIDGEGNVTDIGGEPVKEGEYVHYEESVN